MVKVLYESMDEHNALFFLISVFDMKSNIYIFKFIDIISIIFSLKRCNHKKVKTRGFAKPRFNYGQGFL